MSAGHGVSLRIGYFVPDLNDPATARRIAMLRAAGLNVVVAGFWRGSQPASNIAGADIIPLDRTYDARLFHRALTTLRHLIGARHLAEKLRPAELFLARNLEMLAIAHAFGRGAGNRPALAYEVLDIHRLLLSDGAVGTALRSVERALMRRTKLLIVSSPAFIREYFEPVQFRNRRIPTLLVENKLVRLQSDAATASPPELPAGPPWRLGWFGMIRCRRSFELLSGLAKKRPDLIRIEIAGRPAATVFPDFEFEIAAVPALSFRGAYAPNDLQKLYRSVHFNWAVDYFEENANSEWLLPNRVYEGGYFDAVPLALRRTETGRWLAAKGLGVALDDPAAELESFFDRLTPEKYRELKAASCAAPRSVFIADQADCNRLGSALRSALSVPTAKFQAEARTAI